MPSRKDLVGRVYDELTVVEMLYGYNETGRTYCKCLGKDGEYYIVRQDALQSGVTHRIQGATKGGTIKNISGQRFGKLVAIRPIEKRASNGGIRWECICDCGNKCYPTMNNLKRKHTLSCGCRKDSKWENYIREYLDSNKVLYSTQKTFPDCKNSNNTAYLFFDFYLDDFNCAIEYDGLQHFEPIAFWGGEEKFKIVQENDQLKNDYCSQNNINLIRIPYTKTENEIQQILDKIIHP